MYAYTDADLNMFEYEIMFDVDVREVSINLEVYDDHLSEKEEYFILFLNYSEQPTDRCALAVSIMDNDCKIQVHACTSFLFLSFLIKCP